MFTDDNGMYGRECPECEGYFKVKGGTGLDIDLMTCPYCGIRSSADEFFTNAQIDYIQSIVVNEIGKLVHKSFKSLERENRKGFVTFKVNDRLKRLPLEKYSEQELQTNTKCDICELEYAIFSVFSYCPDCGESNTFQVFKRSLDSLKKQLEAFTTLEIDDNDFLQEVLEGIFKSTISKFDGLGKQLKDKLPSSLAKKRSPFQNLFILNMELTKQTDINLGELIGDDNLREVIKLFQVRHILEHNYAQVDDEYIEKTGELFRKSGERYLISVQETYFLLDTIEKLGEHLYLQLQ
jgi:Zn finger protein HypA/HybF involved in hydrogenase expression